MNALNDIVSQSRRAMRVRAVAPRTVFFLLVALFFLIGVRTALQGKPKAPAPQRIESRGPDVAAASFAESFAHVYLTWDSEHSDRRDQQLAAFLSDDLEGDAGFSPATGTDQEVQWTSVMGSRQEGDSTIVTVAAQTTRGLSYLTIPVQRSANGFLSIVNYPAFVGPPAIDKSATAPDEDDVADDKLKAIATRALGNYLAREKNNLLADLAPEAVVSLPAQPLHVERTQSVTWVTSGRQIAVTVSARDDTDNEWTLRYELGVEQRDRWYVRSIAVDPTFKEVQR